MRRCLIPALALLGLGAQVEAQTTATPGVLYATTGGAANGGRLLTIDIKTGAGTLVGPITGLGPKPGLAINSSGEIFAVDAAGNSNLFRIDAAKGTQTLVGTGSLGCLTVGIAFDENDVLYGHDWVCVKQLFTINTATGAQTVVGNTGVALEGLAFDPTDGTLYASEGTVFFPCLGDGIYTIDKNTGAATLIGPTGFFACTPDIAFDAAGNLYGVIGADFGVNSLISIDKSTGAGTVIGPIGFQSVSGLAFFVSDPDSDDDGIPDDEDACPNSDLSEMVVIDGCDSEVDNYLLGDGCTISDLIADCAETANNHGQFVRCVAHLTNELKQQGIISGQEKGAIQSCAAQSDLP